jgi:hypothetical protein
MPVQGSVTALNLIAGAGILGNVGGVTLAANTQLANNISAYTSVTPVTQFSSILSTGTLVLNANTMANLSILSANQVPAFTNRTPTTYATAYGIGPFTSAVSTQANLIMGNGDLGKFEQTLGAADGLRYTTNILVESAKNATDANTVAGFTTTDNQITGGVSGVSQAFGALSLDLLRSGSTINFTNLDNFGNPSALIRQLGSLTNSLPTFTNALLAGGLTISQV